MGEIKMLREIIFREFRNYKRTIFQSVRGTQWAKNQKVFQGGAGPKFSQFPLEISVLMLKYQKLAKSVGRN